MVLVRLCQSTLAGNVHHLTTVPQPHQLKAVDSAIHRELHLAAILIHHATHCTIHYTVDVPPPPCRRLHPSAMTSEQLVSCLLVVRSANLPRVHVPTPQCRRPRRSTKMRARRICTILAPVAPHKVDGR
jgi:hypothetical protein